MSKLRLGEEILAVGGNERPVEGEGIGLGEVSLQHAGKDERRVQLLRENVCLLG